MGEVPLSGSESDMSVEYHDASEVIVADEKFYDAVERAVEEDDGDSGDNSINML